MLKFPLFRLIYMIQGLGKQIFCYQTQREVLWRRGRNTPQGGRGNMWIAGIQLVYSLYSFWTVLGANRHKERQTKEKRNLLYFQEVTL